ncbi:MAG: solute carrier family 23 protein, partial [Eubacteriales bacterium]|nr:solute carrier family 23 protein [Eubacteriales bacterium]
MKRREFGQEQPYISLGLFKLRIPFIHTRFEIPEGIQGLILIAVPMGAIPLVQETLGCSFEVALTMMILNGLLYLLHPLFGDPVFPGWITPAIPLVMAYAAGFEAGPDRIHAIIALQLTMAVLFTFLGVTGVANKLIKFVPAAIRSGIILGAGIAAVYSVIQPAGRMLDREITILTGVAVCYLTMFSFKFLAAKNNNAVLNQISRYGMVPGILAAGVVGFLTKEIVWGPIQGGFVQLKFAEAMNYTVFGVGFPPAEFFIKALPLVAAAYIIAFGDFVLAEVVIKDADEVRQDEVVEFNPNRSNIITGFRNLVMGLFAPYAPLNGPLWAGGTIAIAERYKHGRKSMDSIYGGIFSYIMTMGFFAFLLPVVSFLRPLLPAGLSLTLVVQGFACAYIAMDMVKTKEERGIAGIMAIFLAFR